MIKENTFKRLDPLVARVTLKPPRPKVKLEVQGKIFSCTSQQNYSELFGLYDQQKVRFIILFISFSHKKFK